MQATIYISTEAMATVNAIQHLDYYDRVSLSDDPATDLTTSPGYYLNSHTLKLATLPADAQIALTITPYDAMTYGRHVSMPSNLRGVIFSGAPHLPTDYALTISYWSPLVPTAHHRGALYHQNLQNSYCISLSETNDLEAAAVGTSTDENADILLSDAIVIAITGLALKVANFDPARYVALTIPIHASMLGIELEGYHSSTDYASVTAQQSETLFLRISDILSSPDPDQITIAAIRTELSDYGYTY